MKNIRKLLGAVMKRWNEYVPFAVSLLCWAAAGVILSLFFPAAGHDDAGLVQALIFGLVLYFAGCAFSWFALRIIFPEIGEYVDDRMSDEIESVDVKTRLWVTVAIFTVYFTGAVMVLSNSL